MAAVVEVLAIPMALAASAGSGLSTAPIMQQEAVGDIPALMEDMV